MRDFCDSELGRNGHGVGDWITAATVVGNRELDLVASAGLVDSSGVAGGGGGPVSELPTPLRDGSVAVGVGAPVGKDAAQLGARASEERRGEPVGGRGDSDSAGRRTGGAFVVGDGESHGEGAGGCVGPGRTGRSGSPSVTEVPAPSRDSSAAVGTAVGEGAGQPAAAGGEGGSGRHVCSGHGHAARDGTGSRVVVGHRQPDGIGAGSCVHVRGSRPYRAAIPIGPAPIDNTAVRVAAPVGNSLLVQIDEKAAVGETLAGLTVYRFL